MKKILAVHFSQTDQTARVLQSMVAPLRDAGFVVHEEILRPLEPFPFPWPLLQFLDAFPESFRLKPAPIQPLTVAPEAEFDLVILAYPVWYLSPSQPTAAFLLSEEGRRLVRNKPVVTVVTCRNMWLMAQETVKRLIAQAGGTVCDHVALVDRAPALATFVTTPRWLLTGRRDSCLGLPPAGIPRADVTAAARFGCALARGLAQDKEKTRQPMLAGLGAATVAPYLILSERAGHRAFGVWSRIVCRCGNPGEPRRRPILFVFVAYLVAMIVTVVPLSLLLQRLLSPLLRPRLAKLKAYYEQPSGSQVFGSKQA